MHCFDECFSNSDDLTSTLASSSFFFRALIHSTVLHSYALPCLASISFPFVCIVLVSAALALSCITLSLLFCSFFLFSCSPLLFSFLFFQNDTGWLFLCVERLRKWVAYFLSTWFANSDIHKCCFVTVAKKKASVSSRYERKKREKTRNEILI